MKTLREQALETPVYDILMKLICAGLIIVGLLCLTFAPDMPSENVREQMQQMHVNLRGWAILSLGILLLHLTSLESKIEKLSDKIERLNRK